MTDNTSLSMCPDSVTNCTWDNFYDFYNNSMAFPELHGRDSLWWLPVNASELSASFVDCLLNVHQIKPQYNLPKLAFYSRVNFTAFLMWVCPTLFLQRPYLLDWWLQLTWTILFGTILVVSVTGNLLVIWIIQAHKRMRTVTNYFLLNLSVADLLMSVLNCMFNFIYMLRSDWPFGTVYCIISNFMANVTIAASVFTLTIISFDRYIAIVKPLEPRMSKTVARLYISAIWVGSMLLALPCLLFSTTVSITYNIVFFITTYLLPILVMLLSYSLIGRELWGSGSIGEMTDRQMNSIKSKRRVVKMFMVIVATFAFCWLPQQAFFLYQYHNSELFETLHIQHIYLSFYWLAMANATFNPVIYYWMNARFRAYFKEVILHCNCFRWSHRHSFDVSPVVERRDPPAEHENSSRSKSDSKTGGNKTKMTPGSLKSKNHLLLYSSRERLHQRNGWRDNGRHHAPHSGEGSSGGQCELCMRSLKPQTPSDKEPRSSPV